MRMEHSENFKAVLEEKTRETESIIAAYLPKEEGFAKELAKAMNYSMTAGGKRLRPLLLQESFRLFGGTGEAVKPFMAAMEMIHTHSLIHDDLPAIDNDDYRRGRKTTHVVFGVLAGDDMGRLRGGRRRAGRRCPFKLCIRDSLESLSTGGAHRPRSACFWHSLSENRNFRHVGRSEC